MNVKASCFDNILSGSSAGVAVTAAAFQGAPLSTLSQSARGFVLSDIARLVDSDMHGISSIADPQPGQCSNGASRGVHRADYSWLRHKSRIACKSAKMIWLSANKSWRFHFCNVKIARAGLCKEAAFDELILVLYTPELLYFYRHDGDFGLAAQGKRTNTYGHKITCASQRGVENWNDALDTMLRKLDAPTNGCYRLLSMPLADPRVSAALSRRSCVTERAFCGVPLAEVSPSERGNRIEALVRRIDELKHPNIQITSP